MRYTWTITPKHLRSLPSTFPGGTARSSEAFLEEGPSSQSLRQEKHCNLLFRELSHVFREDVKDMQHGSAWWGWWEAGYKTIQSLTWGPLRSARVIYSYALFYLDVLLETTYFVRRSRERFFTRLVYCVLSPTASKLIYFWPQPKQLAEAVDLLSSVGFNNCNKPWANETIRQEDESKKAQRAAVWKSAETASNVQNRYIMITFYWYIFGHN